jgi:hypothetical protein
MLKRRKSAKRVLQLKAKDCHETRKYTAAKAEYKRLIEY